MVRSESEKKLVKLIVKGTEKMHLMAFLTSKNQQIAVLTSTNYHFWGRGDRIAEHLEELESPPPCLYVG